MLGSCWDRKPGLDRLAGRAGSVQRSEGAARRVVAPCPSVSSSPEPEWGGTTRRTREPAAGPNRAQNVPLTVPALCKRLSGDRRFREEASDRMAN
jgi:hypothetical protein